MCIVGQETMVMWNDMAYKQTSSKEITVYATGMNDNRHTQTKASYYYYRQQTEKWILIFIFIFYLFA
jgi:hypothetical protein